MDVSSSFEVHGACSFADPSAFARCLWSCASTNFFSSVLHCTAKISGTVKAILAARASVNSQGEGSHLLECAHPSRHSNRSRLGRLSTEPETAVVHELPRIHNTEQRRDEVWLHGPVLDRSWLQGSAEFSATLEPRNSRIAPSPRCVLYLVATLP